eukprot:4576585-Amphidinium_carterae.1
MDVPLPDASMQVIFAADEASITALPGPDYAQCRSTCIQQTQNDQGAAPAASAAAPWQFYKARVTKCSGVCVAMLKQHSSKDELRSVI